MWQMTTGSDASRSPGSSASCQSLWQAVKQNCNLLRKHIRIASPRTEPPPRDAVLGPAPHRTILGIGHRLPVSTEVSTWSGHAHWPPAGAAVAFRPPPAQSGDGQGEAELFVPQIPAPKSRKGVRLCAGHTDQGRRDGPHSLASVRGTAGVGHRVVGLLEQNLNLNLQLFIQSKPQNCWGASPRVTVSPLCRVIIWSTIFYEYIISNREILCFIQAFKLMIFFVMFYCL